MLLGTGIAIVRARGGDQSSTQPPSSTSEFRDLIAEATAEARARVPDATLIQVSYGLASRIYTFHMFDPGFLREVQVIGPDVHRGISRWLVLVSPDPQPSGFPVPLPFDADDVYRDPGGVVSFADSRIGPLADGVAVLRNDVTRSSTGALTWTVRGAGADAPQCVLEDAAPDSTMACTSQ
jgi:hypothetical protein